MEMIRKLPKVSKTTPLAFNVQGFQLFNMASLASHQWMENGRCWRKILLYGPVFFCVVGGVKEHTCGVPKSKLQDPKIPKDLPWSPIPER